MSYPKPQYISLKRKNISCLIMYHPQSIRPCVIFQITQTQKQFERVYILNLENQKFSKQLKQVFSDVQYLYYSIKNNINNEKYIGFKTYREKFSSIMKIKILSITLQAQLDKVINLNQHKQYKKQNLRQGINYNQQFESIKEQILHLKGSVQSSKKTTYQTYQIVKKYKMNQKEISKLNKNQQLIKNQQQKIQKLQNMIYQQKQDNFLLQVKTKRILAFSQDTIKKVNQQLEKAFIKINEYEKLIKILTKSNQNKINSQKLIKKQIRNLEKDFNLLCLVSPFCNYQVGKWIVGHLQSSHDIKIDFNKQKQTIHIKRFIKNIQQSQNLTWLVSSQKVPSNGNVGYSFKILNHNKDNVPILFGLLTKNGFLYNQVFHQQILLYGTNGQIWEGSTFINKINSTQLNKKIKKDGGQWKKGKQCMKDESIITLVIQNEKKIIQKEIYQQSEDLNSQKEQQQQIINNSNDEKQQQFVNIYWYSGKQLLWKIKALKQIIKKQLSPIIYIQNEKDEILLLNGFQKSKSKIQFD